MLTSWKSINWVQHTDGSSTGTLNSLCCPTPLGYSCVWHRETIIHNHATHRAEKEIERERGHVGRAISSPVVSLYFSSTQRLGSVIRGKRQWKREREKVRKGLKWTRVTMCILEAEFIGSAPKPCELLCYNTTYIGSTLKWIGFRTEVSQVSLHSRHLGNIHRQLLSRHTILVPINLIWERAIKQ